MDSRKFYLLELLRFLSAISVIIYHYQIYFFQFNDFNKIKILSSLESLPFNFILNLFYRFGDYGVHMFWCISGFIISLVYLEKIKSIGGKKYFINRFSRLYPLHFITLIAVMLIQQFSMHYTGTYQLFDFNDLYHFLLHLSFTSAWGLEKGFSFNMPIWSVSLEIVAYFLFYIFATNLNKINLFKTIIFLIILLMINKFVIGKSDTHNDIISCLQLFVSGLLIFQLYKKYKKLHLMIFSILLLFLSIIGNFKIFIFCPAILLLFILLEDNFIKIISKKFFSFLGSLTYSLYLWQTPIAMIVILIIKENSNIFFNYSFFLFYFSFLIVLSSFSYYFIEKKLQKILRSA